MWLSLLNASQCCSTQRAERRTRFHETATHTVSEATTWKTNRSVLLIETDHAQSIVLRCACYWIGIDHMRCLPWDIYPIGIAIQITSAKYRHRSLMGSIAHTSNGE